jgi:ABC-type multidrug transport system ATPase subunit
VLDQVGLADRADDPVETYSRGMRQRLGIADALVKSPDLLILDEPTTAIDPLGVVEILELLRRLVHERGRDPAVEPPADQVQSVCDRIGIFASGRLVGQGTVESWRDVRRRDRGHRGRPRAADARRRRASRRTLRGLRASSRSSRPPMGPALALKVRPAEAEAASARTSWSRRSSRACLTALRPIVPSLDDIYRTAVSRGLERVPA